MFRPRFFFRAPLFFSLALLFAANHAPLQGQTSKTPENTPSLRVMSADYSAATDMIQFRLLNNSQKIATDYQLAFVVTSGGKSISEFGFGEDLINTEVAAACGANLAAPTAGALAGPDSDLKGAIKPGDTFIGSVSANLKGRLNGEAPVIHAFVATVMWSDGSFEGNEKFPWAIESLKKTRDQDERDAADAAKVVAILNEHPEDADIHHRIAEAIKSISAKCVSVRQTAQGSGPTGVQTSPQASAVISTLQALATVPDPKGAFEAYRTLLECTSKHRTALWTQALAANAGR